MMTIYITHPNKVPLSFSPIIGEMVLRISSSANKFRSSPDLGEDTPLLRGDGVLLKSYIELKSKK